MCQTQGQRNPCPPGSWEEGRSRCFVRALNCRNLCGATSCWSPAGSQRRGHRPGRGRARAGAGAGPEAAQFLLPTPHPPRCRHLALRGAEGAGKCSPWPGRGARPSGALLPVSCSAPLCWVSELCRAGSRGSERAGRLPSVAQPVVARTQICSSQSLVRPELCPDAFFSFKPSRRRFILLKKKMETDVTEGAINFG